MPEQPLPVNLCDAWGKVLAEYDRAGTFERGRDLYEEVFFDNTLFPLQRMAETAAMMRTARAISPENVVEIGADKGGGFFHWIASLPTVRSAVAVELRGVPYIDQFQRFFPEVQVAGFHGSSLSPEAIGGSAETFSGREIDCLFIDGDKARTMQDFMAWSPRVRKGGLVFIHDITDDINPRRVFETLRMRLDGEVIYDASDVQRIHSLSEIAPEYSRWLSIWRNTSCGVGVLRM